MKPYQFPNSKKIYVPGQVFPELAVPMREIALASKNGAANDPVVVYDTSGPYTDPARKIDTAHGIIPIRAPWIVARGDTIARPRRGRPGQNVTQMHYARQGMVTAEMEFVAIREEVTPE